MNPWWWLTRVTPALRRRLEGQQFEASTPVHALQATPKPQLLTLGINKDDRPAPVSVSPRVAADVRWPIVMLEGRAATRLVARTPKLFVLQHRTFPLLLSSQGGDVECVTASTWGSVAPPSPAAPASSPQVVDPTRAPCRPASQSGRAGREGNTTTTTITTTTRMPDVKERAARKEPGAAESASRESRGGNTRESASSAQGHRSCRFNRRPSTAALTPGSAQGRGVKTAPRGPVGQGGLRTGPTSRCPQPSARAKLPSVTRGAPLPPSPGKGHLGGTPSSHRLGMMERVHDASKLDCQLEERSLSSSSLEGKGKDTMPSDFWEHLKEQLSAAPPDFSCALELLKEIKEILLSLLLPRQSRLRNEIEEALDMEFLQQQADRGDLNVSYLSKYILNMMVLLCAPIRDEAVQRLENISDPVRLLRGIFQVLGQMKMDMVNYTIQSLQPQLQEHSVQFERAQFQERLNKEPRLLNHTTKWLTQAATQLTAPSASSSDLQDCSSSAGPSPSDVAVPEPLSPAMVLSQGFLNLLTWDPENEEFPETLVADRARLQELESQQNQLTILASVLLVASSFSDSGLFSSPQFVDKLKRITKSLVEDFNSRPEEVMQSVSEQVVEEVHQGLESMGLAALSSENTTSLVCQLQNIAKKENCVRSVIDQRIHLFLKCCFVLGVQRSLLDLPGGLTLIEAELAELGQKFVSLTHHNQQVFAPYYTEILKTLISPAQTLTTKGGSL